MPCCYGGIELVSGPVPLQQKGIREVRVCHGFTAAFDDPNLVSCTGLAPVLQLGERAGLQRLVAEHVHLGKPGGVNPHLKIAALVAGMVAGADSIEDMALLRHGAMKRLFTGVRAPSTRGTFLRSFTFGHVRQLDAVASRLQINLAGQAPLLPGAVELAYVDIDDTLKQTYGYATGTFCGRPSTPRPKTTSMSMVPKAATRKPEVPWSPVGGGTEPAAWTSRWCG